MTIRKLTLRASPRLLVLLSAKKLEFRGDIVGGHNSVQISIYQSEVHIVLIDEQR